MMILGEPVLGPLTVPDLVMVVIGIVTLVLWLIFRNPRPPRLPMEDNIRKGMLLHNKVMNELCEEYLPNKVVL